MADQIVGRLYRHLSRHLYHHHQREEGGIIDEENISRMEESLRSKVDKAHVANAFQARNYSEVVRILGPRLMAASGANSSTSMPQQERIYLLGLLAEAYRGCDNAQQALLCGQTLLNETIVDMRKPIADVREATLSLFTSITAVEGEAWLSAFVPALKKLLQTTALFAATHPNRYRTSSFSYRPLDRSLSLSRSCCCCCGA
jgi:hypothetical protein